MKQVLLIEDDPTLGRNIKEALTEEAMLVKTAGDGLMAEELLLTSTYDCVILDIDLPGKNGYEVCREFRKRDSITPVLMLTAFSELEDKVQGYDCGADDYLTKPFYMRELLLRVNALIKRNEFAVKHKDAILQTDDIVIHLGTKKVFREQTEVALTPREFQILQLLIERKGELVSKKELARVVWRNSVDASANTIEVYINFLRNKIDKPFGKQSIKTKIGFGYYFEEA